MRPQFLVYGANGYTGQLIVERALAGGLRPIVAGRSGDEIRSLAQAHALDHRIFDLADSAALDRALGGVPVVLHAAGPFAHTALPMVEGCLRTATHYIDITGEIDVFERLHGLDARAREAGVMLLPGTGFDVVPTDLLAAHLKRRLPGATHLRLAFHSPGGRISRGTARTMVENIASGGAVLRGGRITRVPAAWRTRAVDFGFGTRAAVRVTSIPWGDVATAWHSTGIPNVEVYAGMSNVQRSMLIASRALRPLLRTRALQRMLQRLVRTRVRGPDAERRRTAVSLIHGEAEDDRGGRAIARMRAPEGYTLTALTAVEIVRRALSGDAPAGFQTPSLAYGADWILELGVERKDEG